jgi:hypothetical protein
MARQHALFSAADQQLQEAAQRTNGVIRKIWRDYILSDSF